MANRSIIEIDVQDQAFKQFAALFAQFSAKLEDQPAAWKKLSASINDAGESLGSGAKTADEAFAAVVGSAMVVSHELRDAVHKQEALRNATDRTGKSMSKLDSIVHSIGKGMKSIGKFALEFGGIATGLGVLGAIFAIPDMAEGAMNRMRSAASIGISPGQKMSFDQNMRPVLDDPAGFLTHVRGMQASYTGENSLHMLTGLSMAQVQGMNAAKLAVETAKSLHSFANRYKGGALSPMMQAYGLGGFGMGQVIGLGNDPKSLIDRDSRLALSHRDVSGFRQSWAQGEKNAAAAVQFSKNWKILEMSLMRTLTPLMPEIASYTRELTGDLKVLILDVFSPKHIQELEQGMLTLVRYLGSKGFAADMKNFGEALGDITGAIIGTAHIIKSASDFIDPSKSDKSTSARAVRYAWKSFELVAPQLFGAGFLLNESHKHLRTIAKAATRPKAPAPRRTFSHNPMASDMGLQAHGAR